MEPNQLREGEKIPVPAAYLASMESDTRRRETIGEMKSWLSAKQAACLDEDPFGHFKHRLPLNTLKALTPEERDELSGFEAAEFSKLQPLAQEKDTRRRAYVAAGGSAADFEAAWREYGEHFHIEQAAAENLERAARDSAY